MSEGYGLALVGAFSAMLLIIELLRRRKLSEKYAVIWLVLGVTIVVLAAFPPLLAGMADLVGIAVPANLLFLGAALALLLVCLQLSAETSHLEDETRALAEEVALLRQELDDVRRRG